MHTILRHLSLPGCPRVAGDEENSDADDSDDDLQIKNGHHDDSDLQHVTNHLVISLSYDDINFMWCNKSDSYIAIFQIRDHQNKTYVRQRTCMISLAICHAAEKTEAPNFIVPFYYLKKPSCSNYDSIYTSNERKRLIYIC